CCSSPRCWSLTCMSGGAAGWSGTRHMGLEEKLPSGILLTTVEKVAGYARKSSVWPATFGLACCAIELFEAGGPRHDLARVRMEGASATPRPARPMIVAGPGRPADGAGPPPASYER